MSVRLGNVTFDCADPVAVSEFWAAVLEKPVDPDGTEHFQSIGRRTGSPAYLFAHVPEPKQGKNRVHLDLKESAQFGMGPHGICLLYTSDAADE